MRIVINFLLCISIILSGINCADSKEKLTGKWVNDSSPNNISVLELFSDNTFKMGTEKTQMAGKWTILDDGSIKLEALNLGGLTILVGTIEGDKIKLDHEGGKYPFTKLK